MDKGICVVCKGGLEFEKYTNLASCVHCGAVNPLGTHMECELFTLQDKYLRTREKRPLGEMYLLLLKYAKNICIKRMNKSKHVMDRTVEVITADATYQFILQYLQRQDFRIETSFGKYLSFKVLYVMHNRKQKIHDKTFYSYNEKVEDGEGEKGNSLLVDTSQWRQKDIEETREAFNLKFLRYMGDIYDRVYREVGYRYAIVGLNYLMVLLERGGKEAAKGYLDCVGVKEREVCEEIEEELRGVLSEV